MSAVDERYIAQARMRKAIKIEAALREAGCTDAATLRALDDKGKREAEQLAGVRIASDLTWQVVLNLFEDYDSHRRVVTQ